MTIDDDELPIRRPATQRPLPSGEGGVWLEFIDYLEYWSDDPPD